MNDRKFHFTAVSLCGLFLIVFLLQFSYGFQPGFNSEVSPWWKFFTSIFGHSDAEHLFNNLFFIGLFGSILELMTSRRKLLEVFLLSALFANLSAFFFFQGSYLIGASGGGMGILAALAVYRPNKIGLALGIPLPMWAVLLIYIFINLAGITAANDVAYEAHLFGLVAGSIIGFGLREKPYTGKDDRDEDNWRERMRKWEEKYMLD